MYRNYIRYWKEIIFTTIILFWIFRVNSEADLLWLITFIAIGNLFLNALKSPKGIKKAVLENKLEKVTEYLAAEQDPNKKKKQVSESLFYVSSKEIAQLLINAGADINYARDRKQKITPLYSAVVNHKEDITEFLLAKGAILSPHLAAFIGKIEEIENFLNQGSDVNLTELEEATLLHMAAKNNRVEMAQFLLDNNADVNAKNLYGVTALHYASAQKEGEKLVKLLIDRGAEVDCIVKRSPISNRKCIEGTPLHIAARYNYENIARILIDLCLTHKSIN